MKEPHYPEGGRAERDSGAPAVWRDTHHLVPWLHPAQDDGINSYHEAKDYHYARGSPASAYPFPTYATEGHHLISCDLFKEGNYPELVHNALLLGYDINCRENGFHVPAYVVDIVCHDLQNHASDHAWSEPAPLKYDLDEKAAPFVAQLQERCYAYCSGDFAGDVTTQHALIRDLHGLSEMVRRKLAGWRWYLTKLARMRLEDVRAHGIPVSRPPGVTKQAVKGQGFVIERKYHEAALLKEDLMPKGFPDWDHYIAAAMQELDDGASGSDSFARWLSRRMLREKMGAAAAADVEG